MYKQNRIFEALGGIDDAIAANAIESIQRRKQRRKPLKIILIAAAAAAVMVVMGCAAVRRNSLMFDGKAAMEFNYYPQTQARMLTAEELTSLGAVKDERNDNYTLSALPSELLALYNIEPLMNPEFFIEEVSEVTVDNFSAKQITVRYTLTDKQTKKPIKVSMTFSTDEAHFSMDFGLLGEGKATDAFSHYEFVTLADGSEAFVSDRFMGGFNYYQARAAFCYNGIIYQFSAREMELEEMKQILANFNIT